MSTLPYLPGGQSELPAERFILFADNLHIVQRFDESAKTKDGSAFTGHWETPNLNRQEFGGQPGREYTLSQLALLYGAEAGTTITVRASNDGGETWAETVAAAISATSDRERRIVIGFGVTGYDLRVRIEFDTNVLVNIYGYRPTLVDRGDLSF